MLKKFSVKNFKNFKEKITLDFSKVREYQFNQHLIKNGLINKMMIYGKNNCGKSNLGAAIMDITNHLTDNKHDLIYSYYTNGDSVDEVVEFTYEFILNGKNIVYQYKKNKQAKLLSEELKEDNKLLFKYNYQNNMYENNIPEARNIVIAPKTNINISVLKYIFANTLYWEDNSLFKLFMEFVNNMLWFRCTKINQFISGISINEELHDYIINNNLLSDFQTFLHNFRQDYNLCILNETGKSIIGVKYKNYKARFDVVASSGTKSLWMFYYLINRKNISFIFLDEFDAFYHYELSEYILKYINNKTEFQSIIISHNTYLVNNELMRPDCYTILKNGKIISLADSTNKTIRKNHNLEKMMLGVEL